MIHSILMLGQSNMAGRGALSEALPLCTERLLVLRNGRWQPFYRPVNGDRPFSGVSLAESFAECYAAGHPAVEVGLIPCADGGTKLTQWGEGSLLFDHALYQTRLASRTSTVAAVLWHQGESDCNEEDLPLYKERMTAILRALRKEPALADVPFIMGGLGEFLSRYTGHLGSLMNRYGEVNEALRQIAAAEPRCAFAEATGLASNPDFLHFSAAAADTFGRRYYEAFRSVEDRDRVFSEKATPDSAIRTELERL